MERKAQVHLNQLSLKSPLPLLLTLLWWELVTYPFRLLRRLGKEFPTLEITSSILSEQLLLSSKPIQWRDSRNFVEQMTISATVHLPNYPIFSWTLRPISDTCSSWPPTLLCLFPLALPPPCCHFWPCEQGPQYQNKKESWMKPGFWAFHGAETNLQNQGMYLAGHKIDALPCRNEKLAGRK